MIRSTPTHDNKLFVRQEGRGLANGLTLTKQEAHQLINETSQFLRNDTKAALFLFIGGPWHGKTELAPPERIGKQVHVAVAPPIRIFTDKELEVDSIEFQTVVYVPARIPELRHLPFYVYEWQELDLDAPALRAERLEKEHEQAEAELNKIKPDHDRLVARTHRLLEQRQEIAYQHGI